MSTTGRGRHSVLRIFKGRRGRTGHRATCGALPAAGPYLRLSRFQGGQATRMSPVLLFIVTTSPCQDWVICAPAAFLGCGSRFSGSLSGIEP
ncbi:hypothetical protein HanHA300_Chr00c0527g0777941 [Helianthus annuus]|nr:hypothetical protein HanHA300_Chr00c0670g0799351 [Helianthus annuus]KAJ0629461.1 hypothetical protein HanHA89_Chr00c20g0752401 [Helianthus annuus]KAJ0629465.1 hypothetical protein HanHA89_Chr00c20g0752501 [Helianthus annuus]KAJ0629472.1 hypothetical protein HanHA89_Chr00c20g0752761 [Helianthus annuus]KAJ0629475.1 hypothetical protein HanHA89_Chr00c20g0752931 [Helianthus annuus]